MAYKRKARKTEQASLEVNIRELPNGIRVVHKYFPYTRTVHCGYVINAGSRDDGLKPGLAHFIEHMIFKGTTRRKTYHILNYLESVGGELNAYTTKEKTCLYASVPADYADRGTELLTDIIFNSVFPEKEMEKERGVIAEEIDMYRDDPGEAIFEDFDELVFPGHALGKPILGSKEDILGISREDILSFTQNHYTADHVVFAIAGNITAKQLDRIIDRYLLPQQLKAGDRQRELPPPYQPQQQQQQISTQQAHQILGGRAYALPKEDYFAFTLLMNMLGGPAMNSRLNLNIREKFGLTYSIHSFYNPFLDSGLWGIYYACDEKNLDRVRKLILKEFKSLREKPIGSLRLHQMKKQLIGQYTLSHEHLLGQMLALAKDVLDFGHILPFSTYVNRMESLQAEDLLRVSNEQFVPDQFSEIRFSPS